MIWLHLARLVETGRPLPNMDGDQLDRFVRQAYTISSKDSDAEKAAKKAAKEAAKKTSKRGAVTKPDDEKKEENADLKALKETLTIHASLFPQLALPTNCGNVITHAANVYAGAMRRHLAHVDSVKQRIKRYASAKLFGISALPPPKGQEDAVDGFVARPEVGDAPLYNIVSALESKSFAVESMHPRQREVLQEIRGLLGIGAGVELDKNWLRKNIHSSIRFSLRKRPKVASRCPLRGTDLATVKLLDNVRDLVQQIRASHEKEFPDESTRPKLPKMARTKGLMLAPLRGARRRPLAGRKFVPLNSRKRHFVTVDATNMAQILGLEGVNEDLVANVVRETFAPNIKKIFGDKMAHKPDDATAAGEAWYMTGTFDTDGYSIHPHFQRRKRSGEQTSSKLKETEGAPKLAKPPKLVLVVDPGRVNLVTITILVDGVVLRKKTGKPVSFTLTCRQYYSLIGETRRKIIRERRQKKDALGAELRSAQSAAGVRTGNRAKLVEYLEASLKHAAASDEAWKRAMKKSTATERWRREAAKEGALLHWFHSVRRAVGQMTGEYEATVVWGCKVAATGKGNLAAPTTRSFDVAKRVEGWTRRRRRQGPPGPTVVRGDEYNTSARSCVAPHVKNQSPRVKGERITKRRRLDAGRLFAAQNPIQGQPSLRYLVRGGWVESLSAKRTLRRVEYSGKAVRQLGTKCVKRPKTTVKWEYDGHSGETDSVKQEKKAARLASGREVKYVRGLQVLQDGATMKFIDRDLCGSENIGLLWLCDNVEGRSRPDAFVRPLRNK